MDGTASRLWYLCPFCKACADYSVIHFCLVSLVTGPGFFGWATAPAGDRRRIRNRPTQSSPSAAVCKQRRQLAGRFGCPWFPRKPLASAPSRPRQGGSVTILADDRCSPVSPCIGHRMENARHRHEHGSSGTNNGLATLELGIQHAPLTCLTPTQSTLQSLLRLLPR